TTSGAGSPYLDFTTRWLRCPTKNGRLLTWLPLMPPPIRKTLASVTSPGKKDFQHMNAQGFDQRSKETAFGEDTQAREPKPSFHQRRSRKFRCDSFRIRKARSAQPCLRSISRTPRQSLLR